METTGHREGPQDRLYAKYCSGREIYPESDDCEVFGLQRQGARDASGQSKERCTVPKSLNHVLPGPFC